MSIFSKIFNKSNQSYLPPDLSSNSIRSSLQTTRFERIMEIACINMLISDGEREMLRTATLSYCGSWDCFINEPNKFIGMTLDLVVRIDALSKRIEGRNKELDHLLSVLIGGLNDDIKRAKVEFKKKQSNNFSNAKVKDIPDDITKQTSLSEFRPVILGENIYPVPAKILAQPSFIKDLSVLLKNYSVPKVIEPKRKSFNTNSVTQHNPLIDNIFAEYGVSDKI